MTWGHLRALVYAAMGAGLLGLVVPAHAAEGESTVYADAAARLSTDGSGGDLDGDGRGDLLVTRRTSYHDSSGDYDELHTLTAVRGSNGHRLWSHSFNDAVQLSVMRIGPDARPGVVTRGYGTDATGNFAEILTAYDGRTGRKLWQQSNYAADVVTLPAREHAARLLIHDSLGQPIVISGEDGSAWQPAPDAYLASASARDGAVGDVDGDGYDDFGSSGQSGMFVFSSTSGALLWNQVDLTGAWSVFGDATGDGVSDLVAGKTSVVDGATGEPLFDVANGELQPAGDVNHDGRTDLVQLTASGGRPTRSSTWMTLRARLAPSGRIAWERRLTATTSTEMGRLKLKSTGDLDGDHVVDFLVALRHPPDATDALVVHGADGALKVMKRYPGDPLGAAVDGRGADYVKVKSHCSDPCRHRGDYSNRLQVVNGRNARELFTVTLTGGISAPFATQLSRDRYAEFAVVQSPSSKDHQLRVYDGRTHALRWSTKV